MTRWYRRTPHLDTRRQLPRRKSTHGGTLTRMRVAQVRLLSSRDSFPVGSYNYSFPFQLLSIYIRDNEWFTKSRNQSGGKLPRLDTAYHSCTRTRVNDGLSKKRAESVKWFNNLHILFADDNLLMLIRHVPNTLKKSLLLARNWDRHR